MTCFTGTFVEREFTDKIGMLSIWRENQVKLLAFWCINMYSVFCTGQVMLHFGSIIQLCCGPSRIAHNIEG